MSKPYFSIILPVYNAAAHLTATIQSALSQTDSDFELIIVDDGSTDESFSILRRFACDDHRIKLVAQSNEGVSAARNLGLEIARGTFVAFLDADDLWRPRKLETHRKYHERFGSVDASYAKIAFIDQDAVDGLDAKTYSTVPKGLLSVDQIIAENPACTMSNLIVSKQAIDSFGGFESGMSYAEDQEWMVRMVSRGYLVSGIDEHLVDYRLSPNGLSVDLQSMYAGWRQLAMKYSDANDLSYAEAIYCRYLSRRALRAGAPARVALAYAMQGIRSDRPAFLQNSRRGWLTLISAVSALFIPRSLRIHLFA